MPGNSTAELPAAAFTRSKGPFVIRAITMRELVHKQASGFDSARIGQATAYLVAANRRAHQVILARLGKIHTVLRNALQTDRLGISREQPLTDAREIARTIVKHAAVGCRRKGMLRRTRPLGKRTRPLGASRKVRIVSSHGPGAGPSLGNRDVESQDGVTAVVRGERAHNLVGRGGERLFSLTCPNAQGNAPVMIAGNVVIEAKTVRTVPHAAHGDTREGIVAQATAQLGKCHPGGIFTRQIKTLHSGPPARARYFGRPRYKRAIRCQTAHPRSHATLQKARAHARALLDPQGTPPRC